MMYTLGNFGFEKSNYTWTTHVIQERLHWNITCQYFKTESANMIKQASQSWANYAKSTTHRGCLQLSCQISIQHNMLLRSKGSGQIGLKWHRHIPTLLSGWEIVLIYASVYFSTFWKSVELKMHWDSVGSHYRDSMDSHCDQQEHQVNWGTCNHERHLRVQVETADVRLTRKVWLHLKHLRASVECFHTPVWCTVGLGAPTNLDPVL